ncbi:MAG TPA: ABC transporter permease, partial [Anaerovoracaceae bacterium]|nr:ABC transporter permease [Anaerovoracaceae bacterium]
MDQGNLLARALKKSNLKEVAPLIILMCMLLVLNTLNKDFMSLKTLFNMMQQVSAVGIVAMGAMVVIISGGIDFTAGYGLAMIGMAAGTVYAADILGGNVFVIVLTCLIAGAIVGALNGVLVGKLHIVPFIATLAVMSLLQGMSMLIGGGNMVMVREPSILWFGQGKIFGNIPISFIIYVLLCFAAYLVLQKTKMGVYIYALGGNEDSVRYVGINVVKYKILLYVMAGVYTGIAALITISKLGLAAPSIYGSTLLDAIAAAVIGGTSLAGGRGKVMGTFVGTIIIVLITTALTYLNIRPEMQDVFKGAVILTALCFDVLLNK